jgi:NAD(P)-dependent dehydrogenase (short-subunit alcohol dehydrogenase family)
LRWWPTSPTRQPSFGRIDILVNNAGINIRKAPHYLELEEWTEVIDTNLTSAFLCSKAVHPAMKHAGGGKVINIGLVPPSEVRDPRMASTLRELRKIGALANDDS